MEKPAGRTPEAIIREFNEEHCVFDRDVLFVARLRALGLDDVQLSGVLLAMETTCGSCFDDDTGCQCWNDE